MRLHFTLFALFCVSVWPLTASGQGVTFANGSNTETKRYDSIGAGTAFTLSSAGLTSGTLLNVQGTASSGTTGYVLSVTDASSGQL
jgi:hypothetical protein